MKAKAIIYGAIVVFGVVAAKLGNPWFLVVTGLGYLMANNG